MIWPSFIFISNSSVSSYRILLGKSLSSVRYRPPFEMYITANRNQEYARDFRIRHRPGLYFF